jgi:GNAT superfamily N-acetyltransferase
MQHVQIEVATRADLADILSLIGQPDMSPDNNLSLAEAAALFERMQANPAQKLYVAKLGTVSIGAFSLLTVQHLSHNGGLSLIIEDVVVKTEQQGQGVGRQMVEFAIARARELGCYKLALSSNAKRTDAHTFYERLGFRKHGVTFYLSVA